MHNDTKRGSGRTTADMQAAPRGSVYIWVNNHPEYPRDLARKLGREDLVIVGPDWLTDLRWVGREFPAVIKDHATAFTLKQWAAYSQAQSRVRP